MTNTTEKRPRKQRDILFPLFMLCLFIRIVLEWYRGESESADTLYILLQGLTEIVLIVICVIYGIYFCIKLWQNIKKYKGIWRLLNLIFFIIIIFAILDLGYWTLTASHPDLMACWELLLS